MIKSILLCAVCVFSVSGILSAQGNAGDTVVVRSDNEPLWGEKPKLVETLRIGMIEGPEEFTFGRITALAVGLDGSVFVYDRDVPVIRQYDSAGQHVRNIFRDGQGPGEYRQVLGMQVMSDGRLAIWDPGNGRITVYDSAGTYLDSYRVASGLFAANAFFVDRSGNFYVRATDPLRATGVTVARERQAPGGVIRELTGEIQEILIKVSSAGEVVDSIPLPLEEMGPSFVLMTAEGPRRSFPTAVRHTWSSKGYLILGSNEQYVIDLLHPEGPTHRITREFNPVTVGDEEREQWDAWSRAFERRGATKYPPTPQYKPAFRDLYADDDGRIWVDRYVEATEREPREAGDDRPPFNWLEPPTFDVIGDDGTFFGTVVVPDNTSLIVRRGDQAWGIHRGEFQEQYVVRFKIVPGGV